MIKYLDNGSRRPRRNKVSRSGAWKRIAKGHLRTEPNCAICGRSKPVTVHHIIPTSVAPELELEPSNLITLCKQSHTSKGCHFTIGHRNNWKSYNPTIRTTAHNARTKPESP